ncbi:MAG: deoxyguanosinetriphosphate triphosphohydrolase [Verrucomicrobia bacterium]|nr:deoxyguanosinetriphosphate triphosphohydrolase [Verrucomicrobiota bacterium]
MRRSREELEAAEARHLAPYAQRSAASAGRRYPEKSHAYRTAFQRDRARVIHSRAFRRLGYKTQVFLNGTGDHLRTRLTHTIEVASISRTIARALALNEDLAEAIALAHDLGHPPFGHPGEKTLDRLMREHGVREGFDHNAQSLRIVEEIEASYPDFAGLNLSFEVTEGLRKHQTFYDPPPDLAAAAGWERYTCPTLEAQIANLADEITYNSHDIDDGLDAHLITAEQLDAGSALWREVHARTRRDFPGMDSPARCATTIRRLIDQQVEDVVASSAAAIAAAGVQSVDDVRRQERPLVRYSDALLGANAELRRFLFTHLYYHPAVAGANARACASLADVFRFYLENPTLLGQATAARATRDGLARAVCDYVSGMTDRYLLQEHARLCGGEPALIAAPRPSA